MSDSCKSGIYQIRCLSNGKVYIGSAKNLQQRWDQHRRQLSKSVHHSQTLQRAWLKYGEDQFVFEVLQLVPEKTDLVQVEQEWFDKIRPFDPEIGYNICPTAGSALGVKHTDEVRAKMSKARKGRTTSNETKAKIALSKIGKKRPEEMKARISKTLTGKKRKPEDVEKTTAKLRGKKQDPEHIAKRVACHVGSKRSPEAKARMSESAKKRTLTPEWQDHLLKLAEIRKKRPSKDQGTFDFDD